MRRASIASGSILNAVALGDEEELDNTEELGGDISEDSSMGDSEDGNEVVGEFRTPELFSSVLNGRCPVCLDFIVNRSTITLFCSTDVEEFQKMSANDGQPKKKKKKKQSPYGSVEKAAKAAKKSSTLLAQTQSSSSKVSAEFPKKCLRNNYLDI